ncbi:MAG: cohesin domain-containing protein [Marinagarivorans sp.]
MNVNNALLFLLIIFTPISHAASIYWVGPDQVAAGESFFLDVNLVRQTDVVAGYDMNVHYDPQGFKFNGAYFGSALGSDAEGLQQWSQVNDGEINLFGLSFLPEQSLTQLQAPPVNLFFLDFTARSPRDVPYNFSVEVNEVVSAAGEPLSLENTVAQVQVVPLPAAFGFLLAGMSSLLAFRRKRL